MRRYESIVIFKPNMSEEEIAAETKRLEQVLAQHGAQGTHVEDWGKRDMAYEINKHSRGVYVVFSYATENHELVSDFTQLLRLSEKVLKFQTHVIERSVKPIAEETAVAQEV